MLSELVVENLGVIDRAEMTLGPGSSALTGETGAGKTLLVAALELLCGGRADRAKVRRGATEARVDARFLVPAGHPVMDALVEAGAAADTDPEVVVSRTVTRDGRGKARINGRPVTVSLLADTMGSLVEISGQHEHLKLAEPAVQRALLDGFAGEEVVASATEVARTVRELNATRRRASELEAGARRRARDADVLAFEIEEITSAGVREGEIDELIVAIKRLEHAETLARGVASARAAIKGDAGAVESLGRAATELEALVDADEQLGPLAERLRSSAIEVADVADDLSRHEISPDPDALEQARSRTQALARLRKKYGDSEREILEHLERSRAALEKLEDDDTSVERVEEEITTLEAAALSLATDLSKTRRRAAADLSTRMSELLAELALEGATFEIGLESCELYEGGLESVTFLVAANPGEAPRPLTKVASGGELSRICLALRLAGRSRDVATMIFDEVDAGVGGRAARAVGERLAELGRKPQAQVLVVTHLPQVAAGADSQYVVAKVSSGGRADARVERVEGQARIEELSRMLAGLPDSELAREHAQELLEVASRERT